MICGEGEYILSNYMDALESKSELYNIPGLIFKLNNGSYFENPRAGWIEDISSLPFPDYELWEDVDKYLYFIQQLKVVIRNVKNIHFITSLNYSKIIL